MCVCVCVCVGWWWGGGCCEWVRRAGLGDPPVLYPGVVQYYVRVVKQAAAPLVLRLVVCRFYAGDPARPHMCDADLGLCLRALEGAWADDPEDQHVTLD